MKTNIEVGRRILFQEREYKVLRCEGDELRVRDVGSSEVKTLAANADFSLFPTNIEQGITDIEQRIKECEGHVSANEREIVAIETGERADILRTLKMLDDEIESRRSVIVRKREEIKSLESELIEQE